MKTIFTIFLTSLFLSSFNSVQLAEYEYIEIINLERKPLIEGILNGKKAYFLLDTGSDLSFLNSNEENNYAFNLSRKSARNIHLSGMGGNVFGLKNVEDARLQLGSQIIYARYLSCDMQQIVDSLNKTSDTKICGIIGSDIMKNYGFKIDFENKLVGIALKGNYYTKK
jgi:hypothetical protein